MSMDKLADVARRLKEIAHGIRLSDESNHRQLRFEGLLLCDVINELADSVMKVEWKGFKRRYNVRTAEKCCATCKHGLEGHEGECCCKHPYVEDRPSSDCMINSVCDLWEKGSAE